MTKNTKAMKTAADKHMTHGSISANNYVVSEKTVKGVKHISLPVIMMLEGVHVGSHGPILHKTDELRKSAKDFKGIPVTVPHPTIDGRFVSANAEEAENFIIGEVEKSEFKDGKLKGRVLINVQRLAAVSPEALSCIESKEPLDVSVGVFNDVEPEQGEWRGEEYDAIAVNYVPDHLAILQDEQGACSWADGCGIRTNQKLKPEQGKQYTYNPDDNMKIVSSEDSEFIYTHQNEQVMGKSLCKILKDANNHGFGIIPVTNYSGVTEMLEKAYQAVSALDGGDQFAFVEEVYDDYIVYSVRNTETGEIQMYRDRYTWEGGTFTLADDPEPVRREVEYVTMAQRTDSGADRTNTESPQDGPTGNVGPGPCPSGHTGEEGPPGAYSMPIKVQSNQSTDKSAKSNQLKLNLMSDGKEKLSKIDGLIGDSQTRFEEADKEWLQGLSDEQLDKLAPRKIEEPQVNKEQALKALDLKEEKDYIALMPEGMKARVNEGLKLYSDQRENMINTIVEESGGTWEKEELEKMETDMLTKLTKTVKADADYTGAGAGNTEVQANQSDDIGLYPEGVEADANPKK